MTDTTPTRPVADGEPFVGVADMLSKIEALADPLTVEQRARVETLYAAAVVLGGGPLSGDQATARVPLVGATDDVIAVAEWAFSGRHR